MLMHNAGLRTAQKGNAELRRMAIVKSATFTDMYPKTPPERTDQESEKSPEKKRDPMQRIEKIHTKG